MRIRMTGVIIFFMIFFLSKSVSSQYLGELRLFPYNFVPRGWLQCNGQLLSVSEYPSLSSLLGSRYGGNGITSFGVPNLNGRVAVGTGNNGSSNILLGQTFGSETETMSSSHLPAHTHPSIQGAMPVSSDAGTQSSAGIYAVNQSRGNEFSSTYNAESATLSTSVANAGASSPWNNVQPYIVLRWCISISGTYPPRP